MDNGVSGLTGPTVQLHVVVEGKREIESAIILNLLLVDEIALETTLIQKIVIPILVQV